MKKNSIFLLLVMLLLVLVSCNDGESDVLAYEQYICSVGDKKFETLQDAADYIISPTDKGTTSDTIVLITNVTENYPNSKRLGLSVDSTKQITLNLNNKSYYSSTKGNIVFDFTSKTCISVENGTIVVSSSNSSNSCVIMCDGVLSLTDFVVQDKRSTKNAVEVGSNGKVALKGVVNINSKISLTSGSSLSISDGDFTFSEAIDSNSGSEMTVTGGQVDVGKLNDYGKINLLGGFTEIDCLNVCDEGKMLVSNTDTCLEIDSADISGQGEIESSSGDCLIQNLRMSDSGKIKINGSATVGINNTKFTVDTARLVLDGNYAKLKLMKSLETTADTNLILTSGSVTTLKNSEMTSIINRAKSQNVIHEQSDFSSGTVIEIFDRFVKGHITYTKKANQVYFVLENDNPNKVPTNYKWYVNGELMQNNSSNQYKCNSGSMTVRCVFTDGSSTASSSVVVSL